MTNDVLPGPHPGHLQCGGRGATETCQAIDDQFWWFSYFCWGVIMINVIGNMAFIIIQVFIFNISIFGGWQDLMSQCFSAMLCTWRFCCILSDQHDKYQGLGTLQRLWVVPVGFHASQAMSLRSRCEGRGVTSEGVEEKWCGSQQVGCFDWVFVHWIWHDLGIILVQASSANRMVWLCHHVLLCFVTQNWNWSPLIHKAEIDELKSHFSLKHLHKIHGQIS